MEVRHAEATDARAIAEVHVASWRGAYRGVIPDDFLSGLSVERRTKTWSATLCDPNVDIFVALNDSGSVVGFSSIQRSRDDDAPEDTGEVTTIYVTPDEWGQGYGRALMGAVVAKARDRGFRCLTLWVLEANQRARRFYEAVGFTPDGVNKNETLPGGVVLHEVRYKLDLSEKAEANA